MEQIIGDIFSLLCCAGVCVVPVAAVAGIALALKQSSGNRSNAAVPNHATIENSPSTPRTYNGDAGPQKLGGSDHFDTYMKNYREAERLRKSGQGTKAIPYYEYAIEELERDSTTQQHGPPPAPYREFGKMLYHMGDDERAVMVLDRFSELTKRATGKTDPAWQKLRKRIASGDFRRMRNKYE